MPALCNLAATGLGQMFDARRKLFCHTFTRAESGTRIDEGTRTEDGARTEGGMSRQGLSHRYTMMTLLGLHRYEASGGRSPVEIRAVLDALIGNTSWLASTGDLGLLLWTSAELNPESLPRIYRSIRAEEAIKRFPDGLRGCTMEVAWYLTGLAAVCLAGYSDLPGLTEQMAEARRVLKSNCGPSGVYGHRARSGPFATYIRRRIGSFADQVYPTIALSRVSQALADDEAGEMALCTARKMCKLQGDMGEWSWHYDASSGREVSRYPVYSVHQHAMAPMMLFATHEATGEDFSESIYKGLAWISGNNEMRRNFIESGLNLVWRSIYLRPVEAYMDAAQRYLKPRSEISNFQPRVRYECRPYELGWLLYAFAGK